MFQLAFILTCVFVVLQCIGVFSWPWLWVFSPLMVLFLIASIAISLGAFTVVLDDMVKKREKK